MEIILMGAAFLLAVLFFFLTVKTAKELYAANPAERIIVHWISQIKHLLKNWKPEYIKLVFMIIAFIGFYILAMIMFRIFTRG
ncbi:MAG: hypothetical protein ABUK01_04725 [Leptospirales bacterium]